MMSTIFGGEEGDGDTDHEREEHELEHVRELAADGLHRVGGHDGLHDLHQGRVSRTLLLLRQGLHLPGGGAAVTLLEAGRGLGLDALSGSNGVGQGETDDHGDGRDDEAIAERAQADAAQPPYVADPGHAHDQRRADERDHDHEQAAQEQGAHRLGDVGDHPLHARVAAAPHRVGGEAGRDADGKADEDAGMQEHPSRAVGGGVLQVGGQLPLEAARPGRGPIVGFLAHRRSWKTGECTVNLTFEGVPD
jgi:hypothetical protein